ncbi:hypothetical protein GCM10020331_010730 [Ectobacillus funiculus]
MLFMISLIINPIIIPGKKTNNIGSQTGPNSNPKIVTFEEKNQSNSYKKTQRTHTEEKE